MECPVRTSTATLSRSLSITTPMRMRWNLRWGSLIVRWNRYLYNNQVGLPLSYGSPDPNGNLIIITYVSYNSARIQVINDSLGRAISFHYDGNNLLTAITAPGIGGAPRTLVRLHYKQLNLAQYSHYGFGNAVTPVVRDPNPWVIDAIYYPGTSTGYWFGDSDSYSSYGMLAKVIEQRGMTFSAASWNDMGTVGQGQMTRTETYNYPLYPGDPSAPDSSNLTDAPTYTSATGPGLAMAINPFGNTNFT